MFHKSVVVPGRLAIIVMVISILGKLLLAWHQQSVGKKTCSSMLIANSKNMQSDVLISVAVLGGLFASYFFNLPILDPFAALLVSIWIIWVAIRIFIETNIELMDGNVEKEVYEKVFRIVDSVEGVENPHRMRIRKIGKKKMINIDIEANGELTLMEAHQKAHEVEDVIKAKIEDVFDVAIHIEPKGEHIDEKNIGVSRKSLKG
jgi:cation diffusion facilitator family transporter